MDLIKELGGPTAVARMTGVTVPSVIGWKGRIPPERCPDLELKTGGAWSVERLRPDVRWARVPDTSWPHSQGRPTIDVAGPPAGAAEPAAAQPSREAPETALWPTQTERRLVRRDETAEVPHAG